MMCGENTQMPKKTLGVILKAEKMIHGRVVKMVINRYKSHQIRRIKKNTKESKIFPHNLKNIKVMMIVLGEYKNYT